MFILPFATSSGACLVPNAPCGVEIFDSVFRIYTRLEFLMHRVELKYESSGARGKRSLKFLMHRVELK